MIRDVAGVGAGLVLQPNGLAALSTGMPTHRGAACGGAMTPPARGGATMSPRGYSAAIARPGTGAWVIALIRSRTSKMRICNSVMSGLDFMRATIGPFT